VVLSVGIKPLSHRHDADIFSSRGGFISFHAKCITMTDASLESQVSA
jgi:hypothetical protein